MPFAIIPTTIASEKEEPMEVYIKYTILDNDTFFNILRGFGRIRDKLVNEYKLDIELTKLTNSPKKLKPILEFTSINTGESIKWKYKEGWIPSIRPRNGDLEISINYKIGLTALIAGVIASAVPSYLSSRSSALDIEIKKEELQIKKSERILKQIELRKALKEEIFEVPKNKDGNIERKEPNDELSFPKETLMTAQLKEINRELETRIVIANFLDYIYRSDKITFMSINETVLKDNNNQELS